MAYLYFLLGISFNAIASFILKILGDQHSALASIETLKNPLLYLALFLFGMNVVFYALFLQKVNLAVGYPAFVGGTFLIVLLLSFLILKETLSLQQIFGIALILCGIALAVK